jgi:hypothetical protein
LPISAVDTITLAVEHTKQQLFRPFRVGQWTKLAVVGLLAGELGSGGGFNGSNFHLPRHTANSPHSLGGSFSGIDPALLVLLIAVIVIAVFTVGIVLMYVSSVMRFVLFDSILARECRIGRGWSLRQGPGWRYFLWKLLYLFVALAGLALLIGIPAAFAFALGWLRAPKEHLLPLVLGGVVLFFLFLIFAVAVSVVFVLTKDFVVPQMALENIDAIEGWRRLWPMIKAEMGGYAGYIGMKIVMAIGAGIVVGIATLILGLVIAIPTVGDCSRQHSFSPFLVFDRADFRARHRFLSRLFDLLLCGALPGIERGALSVRASTVHSSATALVASPGSHRLNPRQSPGTLPRLRVSDVADTRVPKSERRSFLWRSQWQAGVRPVRRLTSRR